MSLFTNLNSGTINAIVVYATCSWNAQLVAEALTDGLNEAGVKVILKKAELTEAEELKDYNLIVLVCSTWDVGYLNPHFVNLNEGMKRVYDVAIANTKGKKWIKLQSYIS